MLFSAKYSVNPLGKAQNFYTFISYNYFITLAVKGNLINQTK